MITARHIMKPYIIALSPRTTLAQAAELLTMHYVGQAPVVSADGAVVGMISELDLVDLLFDAAAKDMLVSDRMTTEVYVVGPEDSLPRVAQLFALCSCQQIVVVENGKLVGTVTCRDLLNHGLRTGEILTEPLVELIPSLAPIT